MFFKPPYLKFGTSLGHIHSTNALFINFGTITTLIPFTFFDVVFNHEIFWVQDPLFYSFAKDLSPMCEGETFNQRQQSMSQTT
jgi:hypothetical protein